jgi:integrase
MMDFAVQMGAARPVCTLTIKELLEEFQTWKLRQGRSLRYMRQMRVSVAAMLGPDLNRPIVQVTRGQLQSAIESLPVAARTVRTYSADVQTLLNFAVRREYLQRSPARGVELPDYLPKPPSLHTPDQVLSVLNAARRLNLNFCRELAIRYFAGLRSAEAARLTEGDIRCGYIEVTAAKAKTRRRRLVKVTPNLLAWLEIGGKVPAGRVNGLGNRIARELGFAWPSNVTRHSFCSYHLARFGSAAQTALEAGHTEAMLFKHYREVVTRDAAERFFNIYPAPVSAQIELPMVR